MVLGGTVHNYHNTSYHFEWSKTFQFGSSICVSRGLVPRDAVCVLDMGWDTSFFILVKCVVVRIRYRLGFTVS